MDRLLKFIGLAAVIGGVGYGILHLKSNSDTFNEVLRIFGLISAIALIGFIIARLIWGKNWIIKGGAAMLVGSDLISAFKLFLEELPTPSKETTANLSGHLVYRFTRLGVLGFLLALIPVVLLWQQNQLLQSQNELFTFQNTRVDEQTKLLENQNDKIDSQIQLEESNRRGALIVMMSNIMDKVDDELTDDWNGDGKRNLSPQLIGRIAALSQSFRPYRFWQDSTLIEKPLSPERGQLFLALIKSNLDPSTIQSIYTYTTFENAYLEGANLEKVNLSKANLMGSNLIRANLVNANLENVDLSRADLRKANLGRANLIKANLSGVNLMGSNLRGANMEEANLVGVNLRKSDLRKVNLINVILVDGFLFGKNDLDENYLVGPNFDKADYLEVDLQDAQVLSTNWINDLKVIRGKSKLKNKWMVDTTRRKDVKGGYYIIKKNKRGDPRNKGGDNKLIR